MQTLRDKIYENEELTEAQIKAIVDVIGFRCRKTTKERLRNRLKHIDTIGNYGIYHRLNIFETDAEYVTGKCYESELATLRECILH